MNKEIIITSIAFIGSTILIFSWMIEWKKQRARWRDVKAHQWAFILIYLVFYFGIFIPQAAMARYPELRKEKRLTPEAEAK